MKKFIFFLIFSLFIINIKSQDNPQVNAQNNNQQNAQQNTQNNNDPNKQQVNPSQQNTQNNNEPNKQQVNPPQQNAQNNNEPKKKEQEPEQKKPEEIKKIEKKEEPSKKDVVDSFSKEWSEKMFDYESSYVYMIPIIYKQPQTFYENITNVPCRVRGAFILDDTKGTKVDFKILSPDKKEVYANNTAAAIFDFEIKEPGMYSIIFSNNAKAGEIKPTFTMNTGQNRIIKTKDLEGAENNMEELRKFLESFQTEDKLKRNIFRERRKKLLKNNKYFYTFSVIESIVLIVVSIWQFYYMKNLFEIKGSL